MYVNFSFICVNILLETMGGLRFLRQPPPQENDFPYIIWQTLMNVNIHLYYYENLSRNCGGG